jgi:hypothetical protein
MAVGCNVDGKTMMVSVYEQETNNRVLVNAFVIGTTGGAHSFSVNREEFWRGIGMARPSTAIDASMKNELTKCLANRLRFVAGDQLKFDLSPTNGNEPEGTKIKTIVKRCDDRRIIATFFRKEEQLEISAYDQSTCSCCTTALCADDWESTGYGSLSKLNGLDITQLCNIISENMTVVEGGGDENNEETRPFALVVTLGLSICGTGLNLNGANAHSALGLDMPLWSSQLAVQVQHTSKSIDCDQYPTERKTAVENILQGLISSA